MANNATTYMWVHTTILRWTQALLLLTEIIDPELNASGIYGEDFCHLNLRKFRAVVSELISSTLCLPNGAFCPTILWIARRLGEEAMRTNGLIERRSMAMVQAACQAAMVITSQDSCDGYAQLISQQASNRHAQDGWHRTQLPWPTLRRSFINCPASFASTQAELLHLHATCVTIATGRILLPDSFRSAWEAIQRDTLHGRVGDYVHDFVINFNFFRNFSHERFLATIRHPSATVEGISEWIADGMIISRGWPTNTTRLPMEAPRD
jgi:hypothetical protein